MSGRAPARIYVLAGVNGAGKSSLGGAAFRAQGANYFNPDEAARIIQARFPGLGPAEANGMAWNHGRRLLERAIAERIDFAFETTLGGATISRLLLGAVDKGIEIYVWYVGLATSEMCIARVRARVSKGGHDIPDADIRRRFDGSRLNLIRLLPHLVSLRVFDNSHEADPEAGQVPQPLLVLEMAQGKIVAPKELGRTPEWARSIVAAALKLSRR